MNLIELINSLVRLSEIDPHLTVGIVDPCDLGSTHHVGPRTIEVVQVDENPYTGGPIMEKIVRIYTKPSRMEP